MKISRKKRVQLTKPPIGSLYYTSKDSLLATDLRVKLLAKPTKIRMREDTENIHLYLFRILFK